MRRSAARVLSPNRSMSSVPSTVSEMAMLTASRSITPPMIQAM